MSSIKNMWNELDQKLLISTKLIFFSMAFAYYTFYIFRGIFLQGYMGFTADTYGYLSSLMAAFSFAATSMWSLLSDRTGKHKLVLIFLTVCMVISFDLISQIKLPLSVIGTIMTFVLMISYSVFQSGVMPLVDYLTLKRLTSSPGFSKELYGRQRMWATIGYPVVSYIVGNLTERYKMPITYWIMPIATVPFILALFCFVPNDHSEARQGNTISIERLPEDKEELNRNDEESNLSSSQLVATKNLTDLEQKSQLKIDDLSEKVAKNGDRSWLVFLKNPSFLFFLFAVFMNGTVRTASTVFLSNIWKQNFHLTKDQVGTAAFPGVSLEVLIFFFGPFFSRMGNYWMLVIAQGAMALRSWLYWMLPINSEKSLYLQVYAIELLKGVAFGFTHTAGVKLAMEAAPEGMEATAQALYTSVYSQLPAIFSAAACGVIIKSLGTSFLLLILAFISSIAFIIVALKYAFEGRLFSYNR